MLARVHSAAVHGIDAVPVEVEVDYGFGQSATILVGLPDTAVRESRDRVVTAINNSAFRFPFGRTTINLAPADIRKEGPAFDLPIALGLLVASGQVAADGILDEVALTGELSLDGRLRPIAGALPIALGCRKAGRRALIVPPANGNEAAVVTDFEVFSAQTLYDCVKLLESNLADE